ncbi:MAG: hypothetical protein ACP5J5_05065, partial [Dissulfurimicrobium sp.]
MPLRNRRPWTDASGILSSWMKTYAAWSGKLPAAQRDGRDKKARRPFHVKTALPVHNQRPRIKT